jgi:hypothetical protein
MVINGRVISNLPPVQVLTQALAGSERRLLLQYQATSVPPLVYFYPPDFKQKSNS